MTDPIIVEAKSDREILILVAGKLNSMDERLDGVCEKVESHDDKLPMLKADIVAVKKQADNVTRLVMWFVGVFGVLLLALVVFALRDIGFPI